MKFKFMVRTLYVGSRHEEIIEVKDEELKDMDEQAIDEYVQENYFQPWIESNCEMGFSRVGE